MEDGKDINTIISEKYHQFPVVDILKENMFNGQTERVTARVNKTFKWHSVIRNNFAKIDQTHAVVQYHWERMAAIDFPTFGDNHKYGDVTKFIRSDLEKAASSNNVVERTQALTLPLTAKCQTNGNPIKRCNFGGRKIPISGTVTLTWNTGEKTEHVWESEHWYYETYDSRLAG